MVTIGAVRHTDHSCSNSHIRQVKILCRDSQRMTADIWVQSHYDRRSVSTLNTPESRGLSDLPNIIDARAPPQRCGEQNHCQSLFPVI
jgi:hypothetical protein